MPEWNVLLLGGTATTGKSTSGREIARRLAANCVSMDSLWNALTAATTPATHPEFHRWPARDVPPGEPEDLLSIHIGEVEAMAPALDAFIDSETREPSRLVLEGAWMAPEFAARKTSACDHVRAVFIDEPDADNILASVLARTGGGQPSERQLVMAQMEYLYGRWLREGAERRGLPIVPARPHETLVDRIMAAADCEKG